MQTELAQKHFRSAVQHKTTLGQVKVPLYRKEHILDPAFYKCDQKIIKYDLRSMWDMWRALLSGSHTIMNDRSTWVHVAILSAFMFVTALIVLSVGSGASITTMDDGVVNRVQLLISFIISSFVGITLSRWDHIRNTTLANLWGSLENLNMVALQVLRPHLDKEDTQMCSLRSITCQPDRTSSKLADAFEKCDKNKEPTYQFLLDELARYSQLCLRLTFMAVQNNNDLDSILITKELGSVVEHSTVGVRANSEDECSTYLPHWLSNSISTVINGEAYTTSTTVSSRVAKKLLTSEELKCTKSFREYLLTQREKKWLQATAIGTRPLLVVAWIAEFFEELPRQNYKVSPLMKSMIAVNVTAARGGIGATLGAIGAQLPYPYIHLVYWTVQLLLTVSAIQAGVSIAVLWYTKIDGSDKYTPPWGSSWPEHPNLFYLNMVLQYVASNLLNIVFCEGILNICDKLSNPMSLEDTSFSERVYNTAMYNNIRAIRAGMLSYTKLGHPPPKAATE